MAPQVLNTNIPSLNAQRTLNNSKNALTQSVQRLSSGLRVNAARDDAAGLAIATRMNAQIRGMETAQRNAQDGISLLQTAEGALGEIVNTLQRIRELAIQSANDSFSTTDRAALDLEVQQRIAEITRIAEQTTFNGRRLLDGSFGIGAVQVGANPSDTVDINLSQGVTATDLGQRVIGTSTSEVSNTNLPGTGTIAIGSDAPVSINQAVAGAAPGQTVHSA